MIGVHLRSSAVALLLLAGCAEMQWQKDGADADVAARDLDECRQQARVQAAYSLPQSGLATPGTRGVDPLGRPVMSNPGRADADRSLVEHDLARYCMTKKGYQLVPAAKR